MKIGSVTFWNTFYAYHNKYTLNHQLMGPVHGAEYSIFKGAWRKMETKTPSQISSQILFVLGGL